LSVGLSKYRNRVLVDQDICIFILWIHCLTHHILLWTLYNAFTPSNNIR